MAQINFHKQVLKSKGPKDLFFQSKTVNKKRITFSEETLLENLKQIVILNPVSEDVSQEENNESEVTPALQRHADLAIEKRKRFIQLQEARIKRAIKRSQEQFDNIAKNPELLIGCHIKHRFHDDTDGGLKWYDGIVKSVARKHVDPLKVKFWIDYNEDEMSDFELLVDLKKGDLIINENNTY